MEKGKFLLCGRHSWPCHISWLEKKESFIRDCNIFIQRPSLKCWLPQLKMQRKLSLSFLKGVHKRTGKAWFTLRPGCPATYLVLSKKWRRYLLAGLKKRNASDGNIHWEEEITACSTICSTFQSNRKGKFRKLYLKNPSVNRDVIQDCKQRK